MESFDRKTAYGLPVFVSNNTELNDYLHRFIDQLKGKISSCICTFFAKPKLL